jgi:hypothetical protein
VRIAASIFLLSGLAYASWLFWSLGQSGIHAGAILPILMAFTLIYQAYALFRRVPRARAAGIATSLVLVAASAVILVLLTLYSDPVHPLRAALEIPGTSGTALGVLVAFSVSAAALFRTRDMHPNKSLERTRER